MSFKERECRSGSSCTYIDMDDDFRSLIKDLNDDDKPHRLDWSLKSLRAEFKIKNSEIYFKRYQKRLRHRLFTVVLILNMIVCLFDTFWYFLYKEDYKFPYPAILRVSALLIYICFFVLCYHEEKWLNSQLSQGLAALAVFLAMVYSEYGGFIFTLSGQLSTFNWKRARPIFYLIICNEILLPFPSRFYSTLCSMFVVVLEVIITLLWPQISDHRCNMITPKIEDFDNWHSIKNRYVYFMSDIIFYFLAALVAFYVTYLLEIVNRRAFLDHRKCVESKFKLTFEKDEQERLLSSCLPRHLMKKVRDDIRSRFVCQINEPSYRTALSDSSYRNGRLCSNSQQQKVSGSNGSISRPFKELYIDKYQNVTILYADIVNSMLLTQRLKSPKALIETLNKLFGRFDSRAETYNCLRIKLLGDCYYCVSGVPNYDSKSAENCLLMGLDMIDIIKEFRQETNINVDMRIGIHTGMILSGLLGSKKWQFDIWSIDTMKASMMEHDGQPGFVHVTQATLNLISGQVLNKLVIKGNYVIPNERTYLIERIRSDVNFANHATRRENDKSENCSDQSQKGQNSVRFPKENAHSWNRRRTVMEVVTSLQNYGDMIRYSNDSLCQTIDKMSFNLKNQYNYRHPSIEINPLFLYFVNVKPVDKAETQVNNKKSQFWSDFLRIHRIDLAREKKYFSQPDHLFPYYLFASLIISVVIILIRLLTLYEFEYTQYFEFWYENGNMPCYAAIVVALLALMHSFQTDNMISFPVRLSIWLAITVLLVSSTLLDMSHCPISETQELRIEKSDNTTGKECLYKWSRYYTYSCILAMSSISLFIRINLWLKFCVSTTSLIAIAMTNQYSKCSIFAQIDRFYQMSHVVEVEFFTPTMSHIQYLFVVYLMFHIIDRQIEYISRLDFLWSSKLKQERHEARLMREVNQLLLKNILPIHVAQKFLKNPEQASLLYYEPYTSCAVMFAAIPNFFKFYTENKDNDDGLQYLSVLNDIICEFDKLLLMPQYKHRIEKIKTIGSTYMAAAGLHPGRASTEGGSTTVSIHEEATNLITLIRFSMSMIKVLNRLNSTPKIREIIELKKNSAHFKLRVGICCGPVIAGVVGAVKPQYDIWGDTVNVASRMDTNGISNKIHIPYYVAKILLKHDYFKPYSRGVQQIKGKGPLETYLIDYDADECPD